MKKYEKPQAEVVMFETMDVVSTSGSAEPSAEPSVAPTEVPSLEP